MKKTRRKKRGNGISGENDKRPRNTSPRPDTFPFIRLEWSCRIVSASRREKEAKSKKKKKKKRERKKKKKIRDRYKIRKGNDETRSHRFLLSLCRTSFVRGHRSRFFLSFFFLPSRVK
jgi:hypothetical protein